MSVARGIVDGAGRHAPGLWSFAVAALYVPWLPSGAIIGRWAAVGIGAAILLSRARIVPSVGHVLLACLLAWMTLGILWTTSRWDTAGELLTWAMLAATFCVAFDLPDLNDVWIGFGAGVAVSAAFGALQWLGLEPVWSVYDRPVGLFLSKNMAADAATLALIGCCAWPRIVLAPAAAAALWLVGGRTGLLALAAAVLAAAWMVYRQHRRAILAVTLAVIALGAAAAHAGLLGQFEDRIGIWRLVARNLSFSGDGLGSLAVAAPTIEYAHNELLHYGFELGIGVLLLCGIFAYALGSGPVLERAALVAFLAQSMVWFPLHAPASAFMGMVLAGYLCGCRDRAAVIERAGRMARSLGLFDREPLGVGAMHEADHIRLQGHGRGITDLHATAGLRRSLPDGQKVAMVAGELCYPIRAGRAEAPG